MTRSIAQASDHMKTPGSIDVIVPCYRYGHFLRQCVESVLAETARELRVLIIDDASPDGTSDIAASLARSDSRVSWRRHAENQGHIATFNEGIAWAEADYMLILSADDLVTHGALSRAAKLLDAHPDVGMTYGPVQTSADERLPLETDATPMAGWDIIDGQDFLWRDVNAYRADPVETCAAIVRTSIQKRVGGYRPDLPHAGDYEMWLRFAAHGKVGRLRARQGIYRRHDTNMSAAYYQNMSKDIAQRVAAIDSFIDGERVWLPRATPLKRHLMAQTAQLAISYAATMFAQGRLDTFDQLMAMALQLDPSVRHSSGWRKQQFKRLLGPHLWFAIRRQLRGNASHTHTELA